jgi:predicted nucleotide-binding protein
MHNACMAEELAVPPIVAHAQEWANRHAAFLAAVYGRWQPHRQWPNADDLGRQGLREQWEFDAFDLAETLPAPLGQHQRGADDRILLRVRGLSFVPPSWPLLNDFVRTIALGAKLYVEETGKPQLRSADLTGTLGFDARRAAEVSELLFNEGWMLGSGGADADGEWTRELWRGYRFLVGVASLEDYLRVEAVQVWGHPRAGAILALEDPVGDDVGTDAVAVEAQQGLAVTASDSGRRVQESSVSPSKTNGPTPSVFISYAHEDKRVARAFADGLEGAGLRVWIDDNELLAGDSIIEQISKAVADVDFFCALVSEASRESRWCQHELNLAMTRGIGREGATVIPVRVGHVAMPESILDKLYVQLDPNDVTDGVARIARDVRRHRERRIQLGDRAATQLETRAETELLHADVGAASGTPEAIVRDLNAHVEVAARDLLNRDEEVTADEVRRWASTTGITIRGHCGNAWELRFLAEGRGRGLTPRDELNTKVHFIHDDLVLKARGGHFS